MFVGLPDIETCPECKRRVIVLTLEYPADQKSECDRPDCPLNSKYMEPLPEFLDPEAVIFAHQLSFVDESDEEDGEA